jgi:hypothetical protein
MGWLGVRGGASPNGLSLYLATPGLSSPCLSLSLSLSVCPLKELPWHVLEMVDLASELRGGVVRHGLAPAGVPT